MIDLNFCTGSVRVLLLGLMLAASAGEAMATLGQAPSTLPASSTSTPAAGARMLAATPTARSSLYTLHEVQLENGTSVTVDAGPAGTGYNVNRLYTDVTICYPGSTFACNGPFLCILM